MDSGTPRRFFSCFGAGDTHALCSVFLFTQPESDASESRCFVRGGFTAIGAPESMDAGTFYDNALSAYSA